LTVDKLFVSWEAAAIWEDACRLHLLGASRRIFQPGGRSLFAGYFHLDWLEFDRVFCEYAITIFTPVSAAREKAPHLGFKKVNKRRSRIHAAAQMRRLLGEFGGSKY